MLERRHLCGLDIYGGAADRSPDRHGYRAGQFEGELATTVAQLNEAGRRVAMC